MKRSFARLIAYTSVQLEPVMEREHLNLLRIHELPLWRRTCYLQQKKGEKEETLVQIHRTYLLSCKENQHIILPLQRSPNRKEMELQLLELNLFSMLTYCHHGAKKPYFFCR